MPLKTYETIGILNRYLSALIDGREVSISFTNGTSAPRVIQGSFTTSNPKIQEYIETSASFNKKYRLVSVVKTKDDVVLPEKPKHKAPEVDDDLATSAQPPVVDPHEDDIPTIGSVQEDTEDDLPPDTTEDVPTESEPPSDINVVGDEVVNGQQARNYLMDKVKGLTFRQVTNNQQIIAIAKENNIQFTHWEAFVTTK